MYITVDPNITYMKKTYKNYTNFGLETIASDTKSVTFGSNVDFLLGNAGDLLNKMVLEIKIPSLSSLTEKYSWCKYLGHALIENISISIDGNKYDEYNGDYIHCITRLSESKDKINEYDEMIGNRSDLNLYSFNKEESILRIPLLFWFCRDIGLSLPILKIQERKIKLSVKFREISDVLSVYNSGNYNYYTNSINNMEVRLLLDYIYLDKKERNIFINDNSTYLITQVQMLNQTPFVHNIIDMSVDLNHPVKEILWFLRLDKQLQNGYLDYFNFPKKGWANNRGIDRLFYFNFYDCLNCKNYKHRKWNNKIIKLQKKIYFRGYRNIWQYNNNCTSYDENLLYKPKIGKCEFNNPEFSTHLTFDKISRKNNLKNNYNVSYWLLLLLLHRRPPF